MAKSSLEIVLVEGQGPAIPTDKSGTGQSTSTQPGTESKKGAEPALPSGPAADGPKATDPLTNPSAGGSRTTAKDEAAETLRDGADKLLEGAESFGRFVPHLAPLIAAIRQVLRQVESRRSSNDDGSRRRWRLPDLRRPSRSSGPRGGLPSTRPAAGPRVAGTGALKPPPVSAVATGARAGTAIGPVASGSSAVGAEAAGGAAVVAGGSAAAAIGAFTALAAVVVAVTAAIAVLGYGAKLIGDKLSEEANRIAGYSPELSEATAESELRREMADMRRAQQIGPDLADVERSRSRLNDKIYDIQTKVYGVLADLYEDLEPFLKIVIATIASIVIVTLAMIKILTAIYHAIMFHFDTARKKWDEAMKSIAGIDDTIRDVFSDDEEDPLTDPYIRDWLGVDMARERERARRDRRARPPGDPGGP